MQIGRKIRQIREARKLTQADIERRTGLQRAYTSRIEHGRTVPGVETLEKYARGLDVPIYKLFCADTESQFDKKEFLWGTSNRERPDLCRLAKSLSRMNWHTRKALLAVAKRMARSNNT